MKNDRADTVRADSLYALVADRYPHGEFARRALIELNKVSDTTATTRRELAAEAFRNAERKYTEGSDFKGAVQAFFNVYKEYPDLDIAPKSLYVAAWLTDNDLRMKKSAKALYEKLCEKYPTSAYATQEAKPRIQTALDTLRAYGQLAAAPAASAASKGAPGKVAKKEGVAAGFAAGLAAGDSAVSINSSPKEAVMAEARGALPVIPPGKAVPLTGSESRPNDGSAPPPGMVPVSAGAPVDSPAVPAAGQGAVVRDFIRPVAPSASGSTH